MNTTKDRLLLSQAGKVRADIAKTARKVKRCLYGVWSVKPIDEFVTVTTRYGKVEIRYALNTWGIRSDALRANARTRRICRRLERLGYRFDLSDLVTTAKTYYAGSAVLLSMPEGR